MNNFAQNIVDSGYFQNLLSRSIACRVSYSIDEYLNLLSTLRKLDLETKNILFAKLREKLECFGSKIELSFLAAVQVAQKK